MCGSTIAGVGVIHIRQQAVELAALQPMSFLATGGNPRSANCAAVAMAERVCGTADWIHPAGLLHHVVVFGERHLRYVLEAYQKYYNEARTDLSLEKDAPIPRAVQTVGQTLAVPVLGGLHHQYVRI
jgi:hypothetical protein